MFEKKTFSVRLGPFFKDQNIVMLGKITTKHAIALSQGSYKKIATIFEGFFKDHIRFPRTTRNVISQIVQKCTFPAYSNKTLKVELFASPTSLHFSVHWS